MSPKHTEITAHFPLTWFLRHIINIPLPTKINGVISQNGLEMVWICKLSNHSFLTSLTSSTGNSDPVLSIWPKAFHLQSHRKCLYHYTRFLRVLPVPPMLAGTFWSLDLLSSILLALLLAHLAVTLLFITDLLGLFGLFCLNFSPLNFFHSLAFSSSGDDSFYCI